MIVGSFPYTRLSRREKITFLKRTGVESSTHVVISAILGNALLVVVKFVAWVFSSSPSMLAESIHSFADTANQILLYVGIRQSQKGPSPEFPWGRSNASYLWNLISAMGIFFLGFGVTTYHGVHTLLAPTHEVENLSTLYTVFGVLIFSFLVEGRVFLKALKHVINIKGSQRLWEYIRRGDDPTAVAVLLEDGVAVLGVVMAAFGILLSNWMGSPIPDALTSILIGLSMGGLALILAFSNGRLLIGASARPARVEELEEFLASHHSVEKVISIKTEIMGPSRLRLTAEIEFHGGALLDRNQLIRDAEKIREGGEDPLPILVDTAERMVRVVGNEINEMERLLVTRFPELTIIELEVN